MKKIFCIVFLSFAAASVFAADSISAIDSIFIKDQYLLELLSAQKENSEAYAANEAFLETGMMQYNISRSVLYPQIDFDLSGTGTNSFLNRIPSDTEGIDDVELKNAYAVAGTPRLSITQLLPTAGLLSGSISDTISGSGLKESNYPSVYPQEDIQLQNQLAFSLGISQPLYFKNAYEAGLTQINETMAIRKITYIDNRNYLIISAVTDYYDMIIAAYNRQLVYARLEINKSYEEKIKREHEFGLWTETQIASAMAARLQAEADLLKAEQAVAAASGKLKNLYGMTSNLGRNNINVENFTSGINFKEERSEDLLSGNPENLINKSKVLIAEADILISAKDSAPVFSAGGSYSVNSGITEEREYSDSLSFNLGISIPVTDGGASKNTRSMKITETGRIEKEFEDQKKRLLFNMQSIQNNIEAGTKLNEIYLLQEKAAASEYEKGIKELELGQITQKQLLDLQTNLENIRLTVLLNRIEQNLNVLNLFRLLGFDLSMLLIG